MFKKKWYIFNEEDQVLTWYDPNRDVKFILQFDTMKDALIFVEGYYEIPALSDNLKVVGRRLYPFLLPKCNVSGFKPVANGDDIELRAAAR